MCQIQCSWDEPHHVIECEEYADAADKLYEIKIATRKLVQLLYGNGELEVGVLDDSIGQICDVLDIKCPCGLPRVRRQGSELFEMAASINQ